MTLHQFGHNIIVTSLIQIIVLSLISYCILNEMKAEYPISSQSSSMRNYDNIYTCMYSVDLSL